MPDPGDPRIKMDRPTSSKTFPISLNHPRVLKVVALSGGYSRQEANARLSRNNGVVASFSRALTEGITVEQSDEEFDASLNDSIQSIFEASQT